MSCSEYYLTGCEMEIFTSQADELSEAISTDGLPFDLIELGPGDCTKSVHLLRKLLENNASFTYVPIDISANVISSLETTLPQLLPGISLSPLCGEYLPMLDLASAGSSNRKVVLCLGANIGNMTPEEALGFCRELREMLQPGDCALTGADLKKHPAIIHRAYSDSEGITRKFNLNLLSRMNKELGADIDIGLFEHYCSYDPITGACKSFLIALDDTSIHIDDQTIKLEKERMHLDGNFAKIYPCRIR